jgi:hypothetical protein
VRRDAIGISSTRFKEFFFRYKMEHIPDDQGNENHVR